MSISIKRQWRWLVALGAVFVPAGVLGAGALPFSFSAGTPIRAAEVNANFEALRTRLDAIETAQTAAPPVIGTLTLGGLEMIPLRSFSMGVAVSTGSLGAGVPQLSTVDVVHDMNGASPTLNLRLNMGAHLPGATIAVGDLSVRLTDVIISGAGVSGVHDGRPLETLSLSFAQVEWSWMGGARVVSYDRVQRIGSSPAVTSLAFAYFGAGVTPDPAFIPILEYGHDMLLPCDLFSGSGGGACKVTHSPITIQKRVDASTVDNFGLAVTGRHLQTVDLRWVRTTGELFHRLLATDAVVSGVRVSTSPDGALLESVDFSYQKVQWTTGTQTTGWDLAANRGL